MLVGQQQALAAVVMMVSAEGKADRRTVERATGRWRGSTLAGYLRGDNVTCMQNFRCSKVRFEDLVSRLRHSGLDVATERHRHQLRAGAARLKKANEVFDPPTLRFKVAACMYAAWPRRVNKGVGGCGKLG